MGEGREHVKDYLYGPEGLLATRTRTGLEYHFHKDHLGTPRAISDGNGNLKGRHDYYPYGLELLRSGQVDEPTVKYTGHERDPNRLTDYMMTRTYLTPFMRFSSIDRARDPSSWSLYGYAGANPIRYTDPDGRSILSTAARFALKGGDLGLTFQGVVEDYQTLTSEDSSAGERALAAVSLLSEAAPVSLRDAKGVGKALGVLGDGGKNVSGAENSANGLRLQKQLANEQQISEVVTQPRLIAGAGSNRPIDDVTRLVTQHGGEASDWAKVRSSNFKAADGTSFEIHGYRNIQTGETLELKTKFQ